MLWFCFLLWLKLLRLIWVISVGIKLRMERISSLLLCHLPRQGVLFVCSKIICSHYWCVGCKWQYCDLKGIVKLSFPLRGPHLGTTNTYSAFELFHVHIIRFFGCRKLVITLPVPTRSSASFFLHILFHFLIRQSIYTKLSWRSPDNHVAMWGTKDKDHYGGTL